MMAFFNGKKKSKWLLAAILAITLIATYAVPMSVFADEAVTTEVQDQQGSTNPDQVEGGQAQTQSWGWPWNPPPPPPPPPAPTYVVTLEKSVDHEVAAPGDTVTYTFTVANDGNQTLTNLIITDSKIGSDPKFDIGSLATKGSGKSKTVSIDYMIPTNAAFGTFTNTATVTGDNGATATASVSLQVVKPYDVSLVKTVSPLKASPGDEVTYTFTVTNEGARELKNVTIIDDKIGSEPIKVGWKGNGIVKVGDSETATAKYKVPTDAALGTTITNTATVKGYSEEVVTYIDDREIEKKKDVVYNEECSAQASADLLIAPKYQISLEKKVSPEIASPGDEVEYTFIVTNEGTRPLPNVVITDPTIDEDWFLYFYNVPVGQSVEDDKDFRIPASAPYGPFVNTATVKSYTYYYGTSSVATADIEHKPIVLDTATASAVVNLVP